MGVFNGVRANPKKELSEEGKKFLLENYDKLTNKQIGKELNVSESKVSCWLSELNISKAKNRVTFVEQKAGYFDCSMPLF